MMAITNTRKAKQAVRTDDMKQNKIWSFIKNRRKSTIVFFVSFLILLLAIGIFQLVLRAQGESITVYINTVADGSKGNLAPIIPSLVSFGFVCIMGFIWGGSFIFLMLRGAKKTLFIPLKNDVQNIIDIFDTSRINQLDRQKQKEK